MIAHANQTHGTHRLNRQATGRLIGDHIALAALLWIAAVVLVTAVVIGVAIWDEISVSGWHRFVNAVPHWYAAIIPGFLAHKYLPAAIAHGQTRRETARQLLMFTIVFALVLGLLATVGFLIERLLYGVMDWPQDVGNEHLYSSATDIHLIFLEFASKFLVWAAVGALVGAGFYRSDSAGGLSLSVGWIPLAVAGFALGSHDGTPIGVLDFIIDPFQLHPLLAGAICVVCFVATTALAWRVVRDLPLRNPAA